MSVYALFIISVFCAIAKNLLPKGGGKDFSNIGGLMTVNIMSGLIGMTIFAVKGLDFSLVYDGIFVCMALMYGIFTVLMQSFYMAAAEKGSVSVCSLIYASSFIIQTVFSVIYGREICSPMKTAGIILMLISIAMVSLKDIKKSETNRKSVILAVISMLFAAGVGILQKLYSGIYKGSGQSEYLFIAFLSMFVFAAAVRGFIKLRETKAEKPEARFYAFAFLVAVCVAVVNKLNILLVVKIPGVIFFPVYCAGTVLFSTIGSGLLFNEKLTKMQYCGILTGVAAIIMTVL